MMALAELIETHLGAFEYDWRTRFHKSLRCIGKSMTWGEAIRHTKTLRGDPSSQIAAAFEGWDYAISREALVLLDVFDLTHKVNARREPETHPMRPGQKKSQGKRRGNGAGRSNDQVLALVRPAG